MPLHDLANSLMRKLSRQAERQKKFGTYSGAGSDDAERFKNVNDGEMVRIDNPNDTKEMNTGGIDPSSLAFLLQVKDMFVYMAGNLDALGGLGPQSDTLGQDKLLAAGASMRIQDMQAHMTKFTRVVLEDVAWWLWTDTLYDPALFKQVPGSDIEIPVNPSFAWENRIGMLTDYDIRIEPYSLQDRTPAERLNTLVQVFERFIVPYAPMLEAQGLTPDFAALMRLISKLSDSPELEDILIFTGQPDQQVQPSQSNGTSRPPVTHRINERINRPGATRSGKDDVMIGFYSAQVSRKAKPRQ